MRFPERPFLLYAAIGGFEGSLALALFYRALAMGPMGLTAALTGLLTALVPVLFSLFHDGLPTPLTAGGLLLGLAAIWLITHSPGKANETPATPPMALLLGAVAGIGFGTQLLLFKMASGGGILWAMTSARAAGVAALVLVLIARPPSAPWRGFWLFGVLAGLLDTLGNLFYIQATASAGWTWPRWSARSIPEGPSCWRRWCCASGPRGGRWPASAWRWGPWSC